VVETIAYAHARGVVDRDLKPANVILGEFGEVTVIDWGIAKITGGEGLGLAAAVSELLPGDRDGKRTRVGAVMGTPSYMAPEQALGRNEEVDARTDV